MMTSKEGLISMAVAYRIFVRAIMKIKKYKLTYSSIIESYDAIYDNWQESG
jgi:hypothetical protein